MFVHSIDKMPFFENEATKRQADIAEIIKPGDARTRSLCRTQPLLINENPSLGSVPPFLD